MKKALMQFTLAATTAVALAGIIVVNALAAGNDFVNSELRVDLSAIANSNDYRVLLRATDKPTSGHVPSSYTTAMLLANSVQAVARAAM